MTNKEMKMKMVKHLTRLLIEENVTCINNYDPIWNSIKAYKALGVYFEPYRHNDEWVALDEIDIDTNEVVYIHPIEPTKRDMIEITLQRQVTRKQLESLKRDWKAFYNDPLRYKNLTAMIIDYLDSEELIINE